MTFDCLEEIALGEMGMDFRELELISPRSLVNKMRGFRRLEEARSRDQWERMRITVWRLLSPYFGKGKNYKPWEVMGLPWDEESLQRPKIDRKQAAELRRKAWEGFENVKKRTAR